MYIGPEKIIVVLVIALIVLGPERLPQVARQAGRAYREFRRVTSGLEAEVRDVFQEPIRAFSDTHPSERPSGLNEAGVPSAGTPPTPSEAPSPPALGAPSPAPETTGAQPVGTPAGDPSLN